MLLTQKACIMLVHDVTGKVQPFSEIWKLMYFREHYAPRGHWVSAPAGDEFPDWFYLQFHMYLHDMQARAHGNVPAVSTMLDIASDDDQSAAVASLRIEHNFDPTPVRV